MFSSARNTGGGRNPFDDVTEEEETGVGGGLVKGESTESAEDDPELLEMELPEWLQELPDDLEVRVIGICVYIKQLVHQCPTVRWSISHFCLMGINCLEIFYLSS